MTAALLVFILGVRVVGAAPDVTGGLAGYWRLNGSGSDSSGNGLTLTPYNVTPTTDRNGAIDAAYSFNGNDSYLEAPSSDLVNSAPSYQAKTVTLRLKVAVGTEQTVYLWEQGDSLNGFNVRVKYDAAEGYSVCADVYGTQGPATPPADGPEWQVSSCTSLGTVAGQWHSVAFVFENGAAPLLYADDTADSGTLNTNKDATAGTLYSSQEAGSIGVALGDYTEGSGNYYLETPGTPNSNTLFKGSIDDVRTYNRALTVADVEEIFNPTPGGTITPTVKVESAELGSGAKGLIGHWSFEGDAKDRTPYVNHATVNGAVLAADRLSEAESAYSFNGTSSYITVPDDTILEPTNMTAAAWVKLDTPLSSQPNSYPGIISKRSANNGYAMYLFKNQQEIQVSIGDGVTQAVSQAAVSGYDWTKWHHVGFSYDGASVKIFVDGQVVSETPQTLALSGSATDLWMGDITDFSGSYLAGALDDVRVYSRALGADEILGLHNKYRPVIQMSDLNKSLIGRWAFSAGFEAKDLTPYSNHGTVSGATLAADRHGVAQAAYSFPGTAGQYIDLPDDGPYTTFGTSSFSLSAWISTTEADGQNCIVSTAGSGQGFRFGFDTGNPYYLVGDGTDYQEGSIGSGGSINDGQWHHLAIIYTYTTNWSVTGYIDGTSVGSGNLPASIDSVDNAFAAIGSMNVSGSSGFFAGSVDDVRIYSRALSAAEVQALYEVR